MERAPASMMVRVRDCDTVRSTTPQLIGERVHVINTLSCANGLAVEVIMPGGSRGLLFSDEYDLYRL